MSETISVQDIITGNIFTRDIGFTGSIGVTGNAAAFSRIDQVIATDANFVNLEPISSNVRSTGGYIKIYGHDFSSNTELYASENFSQHALLESNIVSDSEIRVTLPEISTGSYNLFLINPDGKNLTKIKAFTSISEEFGLYAGGIVGGTAVSSSERINYSSDTSNALLRGPLSSDRRSNAATGNNNYGWFGGGSPGLKSTVDRVDYANDASTAGVRGSLGLPRNELAATGNSNYGWFGGGYAASVNLVSTVERVDYANDLSSASTRGPLSVRRNALSASGNSSSGWFSGGWLGSFPANRTNTVDKITYTSDTSLASVRGPLSFARISPVANGNENYSWVVSGYYFNPAITVVSTIDRINYASDTSIASNRLFGIGAAIGASTGTISYGWWAGGIFASGVSRSTVSRIDYSNDASGLNTRGPLLNGRHAHAASGGFPG